MVLMFVGWLLLMAAAALGCYRAGFRAGRSAELARFNLNRGIAARYTQMIALLARVRGLGALDGPFAADVLSPDTGARADALLEAHRDALRRL